MKRSWMTCRRRSFSDEAGTDVATSRDSKTQNIVEIYLQRIFHQSPASHRRFLCKAWVG